MLNILLSMTFHVVIRFVYAAECSDAITFLLGIRLVYSAKCLITLAVLLVFLSVLWLCLFSLRYESGMLLSVLPCRISIWGKTAESPTNIFKTWLIYELQTEMGVWGLPPIIMFICIDCVVYNQYIIHDASPNIAEC